MDLIDLLRATAKAGASDLHLSSGAPPMWRLQGEMAVVGGAADLALEPRQVTALVASVLDSEQQVRFDRDHELDFALQVEGVGRFRGNAFQQLRGASAVFRVIPAEAPSFEQLGLPPAVKQLALLRNGLVLVTGPTGSGKSTTLAAMVDYYNRHRAGHVITIEDPVEFVHRPKRSLVNQREVGTHTHGFPNALRAALREDPDVLLVGEMRDLETISLAITAAETGHLVFATLHTIGAAKSVDRIVNAFPEGEQKHVQAMLAGALAGIVSQALLPRANARGRVAALEILMATPAVSALIREGKAHQITNLLQTGRRFGMQSMEQALTALVVNGAIARETADEFLATTGGQASEDAAPGGAAPPRVAAPVVGGVPGRVPFERDAQRQRPEYRPRTPAPTQRFAR